MIDDGFARSTDPWTSHAAAKIDASKLVPLIVGFLRGNPSTTSEIATGLRIHPGSITPRMKPMEGRNLVYRLGTRQSLFSAKQQIIWHLKEPTE